MKVTSGRLFSSDSILLITNNGETYHPKLTGSPSPPGIGLTLIPPKASYALTSSKETIAYFIREDKTLILVKPHHEIDFPLYFFIAGDHTKFTLKMSDAPDVKIDLAPENDKQLSG